MVVDRQVGSTTADVDGAFSVPIALEGLAVGRYDLTAQCGVLLATTFDVLIPNRLDPGTSTLAVLVLFILLALAVLRRQASLRSNVRS